MQRPRLSSALRLSYCPHTTIRVSEEKTNRKDLIHRTLSTKSSSTSLSWSTFSVGSDHTLPSTKRTKKAFHHFVAEIVQAIVGGMSTSEMHDATGMLYSLMLVHESPPEALTPIFGVVDVDICGCFHFTCCFEEGRSSMLWI